jgi:hypothetical protein
MEADDMKARKWLGVVSLSVCCAVLLGCTTQPNTGGGPGKRPRSYRVGLFKNDYQQLRDATWDLKVYADKMETAPTEQPFYTTVQRRKKDYEDLLAAQREKVKNLLARDTARTPASVQTGLGQGSNKEALELFNSFVNLEQFVMSGRAELGKKGSTAGAARRFYWGHWQALEMMIEMHSTFIQRCGSVYRPALNQLQGRAEELARQKRGMASELTVEEPKAALTQIAERRDEQARQVRVALPVLDKQQEWARAKLPVLREQAKVARQAYETADLGPQAAGLVGAVSKALEDARIQPPPFILFDLPADDLKEAVVEPDDPVAAILGTNP